MTRILLASLLASTLAHGGDGGSFYERPALFSTRPGETSSLQTIGRFGPVGMGIELIQPAFTMRIGDIEEGSPAANTGRLEKGQIIESINGETLRDIDPRIQLADILAKAEATDGVMRFQIKDLADPVVLKLPVLGSYSDTWPLDCPKSRIVIDRFAAYLTQPESDKGRFGIGMLFLLGTGEEQYHEVIRNWALGLGSATYAWELGYAGPALCEYYLRTGDKDVLPKIQQWVDNAVAGQYNDGWAGRGGVPGVTYGMGHLNAAGTGVVTFLLLAKECGAEVPDHALLGGLRHFFRYAGRGGNSYGDGRPEMGFVDNGKNGLLAFTMAAAASLTPEGENSLYAAARDACAMQAFYTTTFMLHGHTGGGIGEIWRSASMGLLMDKRPLQYREFMDLRRWHYDLSRRWDGSFAILGGGGYDNVNWGAGYGLAYVVPRKQLRIFGAPPTEFSQSYQLPTQLWGTEADNEFVSLDPVPFPDGTLRDLSGETLARDSSMPFFRSFHGPDEVDDDLIRRYIHHQDHNIRFVAANKALGVNSGYIGWRSPGGNVRPHLVSEFLKSDSPRVRKAIFAALHETVRRENNGLLTPEIFDRAIAALKTPAESWSVKDEALQLIGQAPADWVAPHADLLLSFLNHEEWWLRNAALTALTPVAADNRCYAKVLPAIGELIRTNQRAAVTLGLLPQIRHAINQAGQEVQQLAIQTLKESYTGYAGVTTARGGQNIDSTRVAHLEYIAASLADVPGGLDVLYEIARDQHPDQILPYKEFFLNADPARFGPKLKLAITPIITDELIPEYVGKNWNNLQSLAAGEVQNVQCGGPHDSIDGLAALHDRAGRDEFHWRTFLDLKEVEWSYHTFDPIPAEQVPFDQLITRYREVTLPAGMEAWFATTFDPAKAGWRRGRSPFGQYDGRIPNNPVSKCSPACIGPDCHGATPVHTLWDKEVLLMHGTFDVPPLKEGHRYRLRVNHRAHVGNGGGFAVYLDGRQLIEQANCIGRGGGEKPYGAYITREWIDDFADGKITIAVKSFLRFNDKYKVKPDTRVPQGMISVHLEEQKLPAMGDDLRKKSATLIPMTSSEWQAARLSESDEEKESAPTFRWDGKFVPNAPLIGNWQVIAQVAATEDFDPHKTQRPNRPPFTELSFSGGGDTGSPAFVWSGDRLMDLARYQALKIQPHTLDGTPYLFIEAGGFSDRNRPGWSSPWLVLARE